MTLFGDPSTVLRATARPNDGGHGFFPGVAAQDGSREATSGSGRVRRVAEGRDRLVTDTDAVRGQGSLSARTKQLLTLLHDHDWLPAHVEQAQKWHDAFLTSASRYDSAAQQAGTLLESALVDLYHLDRAEQAAEFVPEHPAPQREQEIPQSITQDGRVFEVKISSLRWDQDTPGMAINRLATLAEAAMPDRWLLVTYVERQRSLTYDPVIYAGYGAWYLKVAEWV